MPNLWCLAYLTPNPLTAGLFDTYPQASSTKMLAGLFDAYSIHEIETYKPSSVTREYQGEYNSRMQCLYSLDFH